MTDLEEVLRLQAERERGLICGRCQKPTGNNTQGHYWAFCKVTRQLGGFHFCCPDDCELHPDDRRDYVQLPLFDLKEES